MDVEFDQTKGWKVWLIVWRSAVQLFYLGVVLAVFSSVHTPMAQLMTALSGIVYVTVRTAQLSQALYFQGVFSSIILLLDEIKCKISDSAPVDFAEVEQKQKDGKIKVYFDMAGLAAVFIVCLGYVDNAINSGSL